MLYYELKLLFSMYIISKTEKKFIGYLSLHAHSTGTLFVQAVL
jgi:hypothetical protein